MQAVTESRLVSARQDISVRRDTSPDSGIVHSRRDALIFPEDVVNLSTELDHFYKKAPSVPVTSAESKALRDSFSVYA